MPHSGVFLVIVTSQPGATMQTFDQIRCRNQVLLPVLSVLAASVVQGVLFVIMCDKESPVAEVSYPEDRREEGSPPHLMTPTSRYLHNRLESMLESKTGLRINCLNIAHWGKQPETVLHHSLAFARNQGAKRVIAVPYGMHIPTISEVQEMLADMGRAKKDVYLLKPETVIA